MALEHLEWAQGIARHAAKMLPTWFHADDLMAPVEIALLGLAAKYDPSLGVPFKAYARPRIYGACLDAVRRKEYRERSHASLDNYQDGGRRGSHFGGGGRSRHQASDRWQNTLEAAIACPLPSPEELASQKEQSRVWAQVQQLPSRHALVILAVYGGGMTLEALSLKVDVGSSRLSQIHHEALGMLRQEMRKAA